MGIRSIQWRERAMMRWEVVTAMLLLALNNITYAQIADVTGIGEDSDSALRDAKRNAVEQVVGTYINSETLVSQASVVLEFSTEIPDMSAFEIPKKYQDVKQ